MEGRPGGAANLQRTVEGCVEHAEHEKVVLRPYKPQQKKEAHKMDEVEMVNCTACGHECEPGELYQGYCQECLREEVYKYKYDVDSCYSVGESCKEDVKINGLLVAMFEADEIEAILYRHLKDASLLAPVDCSWFIEADESWFRDEVVKKLKGGK